MVSGRTTGAIVQAWQNRAFTRLTPAGQIAELHECFTRPWLVPDRIRRHEAGRLIDTIRRFAVFARPLPAIARSPDPDDDFLLALAEAGNAGYLVSGDKAGLLALRTHRGTQIIRARDFVQLIRQRRPDLPGRSIEAHPWLNSRPPRSRNSTRSHGGLFSE